MDADLELASALGRQPICSCQGPEGFRPSRIDGLLVDTRLASVLHVAERVTRGAITGHAPVRFHLHLRGSSQRVVKLIRPKPIALALREEHERLLLTRRLLDPLQAGWQAALSTGDMDRAWGLWTTVAEGTLLPWPTRTSPLTLTLTTESLPDGAMLPPPAPHLPRGRGTDQLLREVRLYAKQRRNTQGGRFPTLWRAFISPGTSPGRPPLAGTTGTRLGRDAPQDAAGMGGAPASPWEAPRVGLRVY